MMPVPAPEEEGLVSPGSNGGVVDEELEPVAPLLAAEEEGAPPDDW